VRDLKRVGERSEHFVHVGERSEYVYIYIHIYIYTSARAPPVTPSADLVHRNKVVPAPSNEDMEIILLHYNKSFSVSFFLFSASSQV
jgi:hypothetical protein